MPVHPLTGRKLNLILKDLIFVSIDFEKLTIILPNIVEFSALLSHEGWPALSYEVPVTSAFNYPTITQLPVINLSFIFQMFCFNQLNFHPLQIFHKFNLIFTIA